MVKKNLESFVVEGKIREVKTDLSRLYVVLETKNGEIYPITDELDHSEMADAMHDFLKTHMGYCRGKQYIFSKKVLQSSAISYRGVEVYKILRVEDRDE